MILAEDLDADPVCQWDTKRKPFSLAEVYALVSAVTVKLMFLFHCIILVCFAICVRPRVSTFVCVT